MSPRDKPEPGAGDSELAAALLGELGDETPVDALIYDEDGNPISPAAKART
jgi:hypothetical protein